MINKHNGTNSEEYEFFSSAEIPNVEFAKQSCRRENAHRSRHFSRARDYKPRASKRKLLSI